MCAHMLTGSNNESVYMMLHLVLWPILITHGVMLMKSMHTQVPAHKYTILKVGQTHTHTTAMWHVYTHHDSNEKAGGKKIGSKV